MLVATNGLTLIAEFEGFAPYLYNDPVGHATIGYGYLVHLGPYHVQRGICSACDKWPRAIERHLWITPEAGRRLLAEKVIPYAQAVDTYTREISQNAFDACTSLCYNIGQGGYAGSSVARAINNFQDPCPSLRTIVRGTDGLVYPGLVRRREAECQLFHSQKPNSLPGESNNVDMILAEWWSKGPHGGWHGPGPGMMNCFADFGPGRLYEVVIALEPDSQGAWILQQGIQKNGKYPIAGVVGNDVLTEQVILIPGMYGTIPFNIIGGKVHVKYVALTGVVR